MRELSIKRFPPNRPQLGFIRRGKKMFRYGHSWRHVVHGRTKPCDPLRAATLLGVPSHLPSRSAKRGSLETPGVCVFRRGKPPPPKPPRGNIDQNPWVGECGENTVFKIPIWFLLIMGCSRGFVEPIHPQLVESCRWPPAFWNPPGGAAPGNGQIHRRVLASPL